MITEQTIWSIIRGHIPKRQWVSSNDIYAMVETYGNLDEEDWRPQSRRSKNPKWKRLVQNVLSSHAKWGEVRRRDHQDDRLG